MSDATARLIELDCVFSADQAKEVIARGDQRVNGVDSLPALRLPDLLDRLHSFPQRLAKITIANPLRASSSTVKVGNRVGMATSGTRPALGSG